MDVTSVKCYSVMRNYFENLVAALVNGLSDINKSESSSSYTVTGKGNRKGKK